MPVCSGEAGKVLACFVYYRRHDRSKCLQFSSLLSGEAAHMLALVNKHLPESLLIKRGNGGGERISYVSPDCTALQIKANCRQDSINIYDMGDCKRINDQRSCHLKWEGWGWWAKEPDFQDFGPHSWWQVLVHSPFLVRWRTQPLGSHSAQYSVLELSLASHDVGLKSALETQQAGQVFALACSACSGLWVNSSSRPFKSGGKALGSQTPLLKRTCQTVPVLLQEASQVFPLWRRDTFLLLKVIEAEWLLYQTQTPAVQADFLCTTG